MKKKTINCILMILFFSLVIGGIMADTLPIHYHSPIVIAAAAVILGTIVSLIFNRLMLKLIEYVRKANFTHLIIIMICLGTVCICGGLISIPIAVIPGWIGQYGPIVFTAFIFIFVSICKFAMQYLSPNVHL